MFVPLHAQVDDACIWLDLRTVGYFPPILDHLTLVKEKRKVPPPRQGC